MEDKSPELGGPSGQSGAPLQIQSIPIRRQRPVPTFFAITNCHHGDHHKKDSSQMQSFPGKFLPFSSTLPLGLHALLPLTSVPWFLEGAACVRVCECVCMCVFKKSRTEEGLGPEEMGLPSSPRAPGLQLPCSSADRQSDGKPLSLSVEWLSPLPSLFSPPRSLRHGPWQACEGQRHTDMGKGSREGPANEGLGYPWEGGRSSQESCLYVCFLN